MKSIVTASATACLAVLLLSGMSTDESASESKVSESHDTGIPLERLIAIVARKTNKKYLLDPRVNAQVHLVGQDPSSLTYNELLTILQVYGFVAMEGGGYIRVLPDANARQTAQPPITAGQTYPDAQYVTYVIPVKNSPASMLVPILRPLLPQYAHLAAYNCSNTLLIADSFANVKRIETLVKQLDVGEPYKDTACGPASDAHR